MSDQNKYLYWNEITLRRIEVLLIGAGGNGSEMFDGLIKIDQGLKAKGYKGLRVTVVDDDYVESSNVVRQKYWPHEVGQPKALSLVHRANLMMGLDWRSIEARFPPTFSTQHLIPVEADIVISCVDNIDTRRQIAKLYEGIKTHALWLDVGNDDSFGQVVLGHLSKNHKHDYVSNVMDIYPELWDTEDKPSKPSCSAAESLEKQDLFINQKVAAAGLNLLWQLFTLGSIKHNVIMIDAKNLEETPIPISDSLVHLESGKECA